MTPDTRMLSGSTGESFVAAVVLAPVQEGQLDLDQPIAPWLGGEPWFVRLPNGGAITLRMLLRHQSGLMDHLHTEPFEAAAGRARCPFHTGRTHWLCAGHRTTISGG